MSQRGHRRRIGLFFVAIIVPSLVLLALSFRIIQQEQELAEKHHIEEKQRLFDDVRRELLIWLEKTRLQETRRFAQTGTFDAGTPEIVLVSWVEKDRPLLPWELPGADDSQPSLTGHDSFSRYIQQGELEELARKQYGRAVLSYQKAIQGTENPAQAAYARLLLSRVLAKSGKKNEADVQYKSLLALSSGVIDEHGVPFAWYGAARMLETKKGFTEILERVRADSLALHGSSPPAAYLLEGLLDSLYIQALDSIAQIRIAGLQERLKRHLQVVEQALSLQSDFPRLGFMSSSVVNTASADPLWIPYGEDPWLVSITPPLGDIRPILVAVRAREVFDNLEKQFSPSVERPYRVHFSVRRNSEGALLGASLPGLSLSITDETEVLSGRWNLQHYFYYLALLVVLSATLFGAYLLSRDMRREVHLAELRSQFVSSVTHELKTPLTSIRMFAETLRLRRSPDLNVQSEYLDIIISESERLSRLLNNVLDFSKIEHGDKTYHRAPASLPDVVNAAARTLHYPLTQQGFTLHLEVNGELPEVPVDADALQQAILNLVHNAMKYSGESRKIELNVKRQEEEAVIDVKDYGIGIASEDQNRIFDKFYRVASPDTAQISGTGLGLTLVAHVARAHGGRVSVQSAPGHGSTFSIHLPLHEKV